MHINLGPNVNVFFFICFFVYLVTCVFIYSFFFYISDLFIYCLSVYLSIYLCVHRSHKIEPKNNINNVNIVLPYNRELHPCIVFLSHFNGALNTSNYTQYTILYTHTADLNYCAVCMYVVR